MKIIIEPLVSIITVVLNGRKTIEQTILSVRNQSYANIEYIIIDGGSTDGTINIIEKYSEGVDFWISESDNGLYDAMNKGIGYANGELIGLLNSDDYYESDAVSRVIEAYKSNRSSKIFHGDRMDILSTGHRQLRKFDPSNFMFKYYSMTYHHPSMFIHRDCYREFLYNKDLRVYSDYQFVLELYLKHSEYFHYIEGPYVNYRLEGASTRINTINKLREGYIARRLAGMSRINSLFSFVLRLGIFMFYHPKPKSTQIE